MKNKIYKDSIIDQFVGLSLVFAFLVLIFLFFSGWRHPLGGLLGFLILEIIPAIMLLFRGGELVIIPEKGIFQYRYHKVKQIEVDIKKITSIYRHRDFNVYTITSNIYVDFIKENNEINTHIINHAQFERCVPFFLKDLLEINPEIKIDDYCDKLINDRKLPISEKLKNFLRDKKEYSIYPKLLSTDKKYWFDNTAAGFDPLNWKGYAILILMAYCVYVIIHFLRLQGFQESYHIVSIFSLIFFILNYLRILKTKPKNDKI